MARNSTSRATIEVTTNAQKAKNDIEEINNLLKKLQKTKQLMMKEGLHIGPDGKETATFKKLNQDIKSTTQALKDNQNAQEKMKATLADLGNIRLKDLKRRYRELTKELGNFSGKEAAQAKQWRDNLARIKAQIVQIEGAGASASKSMSGFGGALRTTLKNLVAYAGVFTIFNKIKSAITGLAQKNLEFSDELTNIRKVSQLTEADINRLAVGLAKIDTRSTVNELNNLAYAGAKLGIGKWGVEGLQGFVVAADKVNVALKEYLGTDALTALSKLVEVMGLIPKMGVEKSMEAAGSAIFALSTSSTATGANIIEFSKRLMGLANVSHVAVDELLALGSASDAMGLMPEVSATAFNKVFTSIQTNTRGIARALGDAKGELQSFINEGNTMQGIVYVLEKMHNMSVEEMKGRGLFKALGSDGARLNNVIATMANRVDMLKEHLDVSNDAFVEATAIQKEYEMQMESAQGYMDRAANVWTKAFVNPEGVDVMKQFAQEWYNIANEMTHSATTMQMITTSLKMLAGLVTTLIKFLPVLIRLMMFFGIAKAIQYVYTQVLALTTALNSATTAAGRLNAVMKANAFAFAASAVLTLVTSMLDATKAEEELAEKQKSLNSYIADGYVELNRHKLKIDEYIKALEDSNLKEETRRKILARFNKEYKPYLDKLGLEINSVESLKNSYAALNTELRKKIFYDMKNKALEEYTQESNDRLQRATMDYYDVSKESGIDYLSASDIISMADQGKNSYEIMAQIIERRASAKGKQVIWLSSNPNNPYQSYQYAGSDAIYNTDQYSYDFINPRDGVKIPVSQDSNFVAGVWDAINDITTSSNGLTSTINAVNKAFQGFDTQWVDLVDEGAPTSDYVAPPTKDELRDAKEALRKDLKDAKEESDAIISKIEEWYRLQETVITDMQADGRLTKEQAEQVVRTLNMAKNKALADARLAISGRDTETWEQTKQGIGQLMLDQGQWSQELLQQILGVSMSAIRSNLARIDQAGGQYGITTTSLKDAIDKNAAGNLREIARLQAKGQEEVQKMLDQYHFVEQAMKGFSNRLAQMGILTETARQMAQRLSEAKLKSSVERATGGTGIASLAVMETMRIQQEQAKKQMAQAFIKTGTQPYAVDPNNTQQLADWFNSFVMSGPSYMDEETGKVVSTMAEWAEPFKEDFNLWLNDSETYKTQIQAFYFSLLQTEEEYFDARKKAYNKAKKDFDQMWEVSGQSELFSQYQQQLDLRQRGLELTGKDKGTNFVDQAGFSSLNEDPEIAASILRMEQAQRELEMLRQVNANKKLEGEELLAHQQLMREKEQALADASMSMQEALMAKINERISKMQEWTGPIEDFGTKVGQALYDQWHNGESMTAKWQDMLKSLALSWGQTTVSIVKELMMQQIKQKLINKAMQAEETGHQAMMANIQQTGEATRELISTTSGQARVAGEQVTNAAIETEQATHDTTMLAEETGQAAAENTVNISRAAGKTLADLGWWGIPLVAVITALLNMLLQAALGSSNKNSKSTSTSSSSATKTKLVSGMLTYDEGTGVPDAAVPAASPAGNKQSYLGTDGRVYRATPQQKPLTTGLITQPIATTVNGRPALVAERGPEIVIGRRTTRHIMMNEPGLLRHLQQYDRHYSPRPYAARDLRPYDEGNLAESVLGGSVTENGQQSNDRDARLADTLTLLTAAVQQLQQSNASLEARLQKPIQASINKYGTGGLIEEVQSGLKFYNKYKG